MKRKAHEKNKREKEKKKKSKESRMLTVWSVGEPYKNAIRRGLSKVKGRRTVF